MVKRLTKKQQTKKGTVMTDTLQTNESNETQQRETPQPWNLFADELDSETIRHMAQFWSEDLDTLAETLWYFRRSYMNMVTQRDEAKTVNMHARSRIVGMQTIAERDKIALRQALEVVYGDSPKVAMDWEGWPVFLHITFFIGIMTGNAGEVHRLAIALKEHNEIQGAEEIWDTVSRGLRTSEGHYPNPVPAEEAVGMAWREYGWKLPNRIHPADPRLDNGWQLLWRLAKAEGLCEVFDTLAEGFGIHKPEVTRSGTISVRFTGYVDVPIEGWDGEDIYEVIDEDEIRQALRYDGHLEIDDVDTSDMSWD